MSHLLTFLAGATFCMALILLAIGQIDPAIQNITSTVAALLVAKLCAK
jgi:hypothetical protein